MVRAVYLSSLWGKELKREHWLPRPFRLRKFIFDMHFYSSLKEPWKGIG